MSFPTRPCMILAILATIAPLSASAQVPDTDIWLVDVRGAGTSSFRMENPVNVTRRPGYDNQPAFLYIRDTVGDEHGHVRSVNRAIYPRVGLLYVAADSLGSTDIFRWDPETKTSVPLTRTPESEYSPTPFGVVASGGPAGFYTVRVEADSTQRLWQFDIDGSNPRVVMADVDSIGYFAWIDETHLAAFVLGNEARKEPHTLRVIDVKAQTETIVARDIGRAIHRMPGMGDISFTVQEEDDSFRFMCLRHGRTTPEPLIDAVGTGQDAAWLGTTMLMSAGPKIYAAIPGAKGESGAWRPVADFSDTGITGIMRMAVSPDHRRLAVVAVTSTP